MQVMLKDMAHIAMVLNGICLILTGSFVRSFNLDSILLTCLRFWNFAAASIMSQNDDMQQ